MLQIIIGLACFASAIFFLRREPRRLLIGILLEIGIINTISGIVFIIYPHSSGPNQVVARSSEIIVYILMVLLAVLVAVGVYLIFNGFVLIKKESISAAHLLPIFFGISSVLYPVFIVVDLLMRVNVVENKLYFLGLNLMLDIALYVPLMLCAFLIASLVYRCIRKPKGCDYIIVLGCAVRNGRVSPILRKRLDRAVAWYKQGGEKSTFIVSGGQGNDEDVSEAYAMKQYLLEQAVPDMKIIMEDKSTSTDENFLFSKGIMDEQKRTHTSIFATNNYHVFRAAILAKSIGLNSQGVGCKTALYYLPGAFIREYIAVIFKYKNLALIYMVYILAKNVWLLYF